MVHPWGFVNSRRDTNGALLGFCEWCTLATFATCKPLGLPRGLQVAKVASPLGDIGAYKSPNSQAPCETKGFTCRKSSKPLGGPRSLYVVKVASPLRDQGAYKSQKSQAPLGDQEAYMSPKS